MSLDGLKRSSSPVASDNFRVTQIAATATHAGLPALLKTQLNSFTSLTATNPVGLLICNTTTVVLYLRTNNEAGTDAVLGIPIAVDQSLYLPLHIGSDFFNLAADIQIKLASGTGNISVAVFF